MRSQTVTLELPEPLYEQLQARAARRQRTVADEVLDVLTGASPVTETLPDDLEQAIAQLVFLCGQAIPELKNRWGQPLTGSSPVSGTSITKP
jgi:plasmid stability protein